MDFNKILKKYKEGKFNYEVFVVISNKSSEIIKYSIDYLSRQKTFKDAYDALMRSINTYENFLLKKQKNNEDINNLPRNYETYFIVEYKPNIETKTLNIIIYKGIDMEKIGVVNVNSKITRPLIKKLLMKIYENKDILKGNIGQSPAGTTSRNIEDIQLTKQRTIKNNYEDIKKDFNNRENQYYYILNEKTKNIKFLFETKTGFNPTTFLNRYHKKIISENNNIINKLDNLKNNIEDDKLYKYEKEVLRDAEQQYNKIKNIVGTNPYKTVGKKQYWDAPIDKKELKRATFLYNKAKKDIERAKNRRIKNLEIKYKPIDIKYYVVIDIKFNDSDRSITTIFNIYNTDIKKIDSFRIIFNEEFIKRRGFKKLFLVQVLREFNRNGKPLNNSETFEKYIYRNRNINNIKSLMNIISKKKLPDAIELNQQLKRIYERLENNK